MKAGLLVVVGLLLLQEAVQQKPDDDGKVLAQSDFLWDAEGWTTTDPSKYEIVHGMKIVKAADKGEDSWYFVAPPKFLGVKREAYGGYLQFTHGFFEYDSAGQDMVDGFDVILQSEAFELELRLKYVIPPWVFRSEHKIELVETEGWEHALTGGVPSKPDMLRVLSNLSGIRIRGGFYAGHEDSYISAVKLVAGPEDDAPPKTSLKGQRILSGVSQGPALKSDYVPGPPMDDTDAPPPPLDDEL